MKKRTSTRISQRAIAERLGVSQALVSSALNGRKTTSPRSRDRVIQTAIEMGYEPPASYFRFIKTITAAQLKKEKFFLSEQKKTSPMAVRAYLKSKVYSGFKVSETKLAKEISAMYPSLKVSDARNIVALINEVNEYAASYRNVKVASELMAGTKVSAPKESSRTELAKKNVATVRHIENAFQSVGSATRARQ